MGYRVDASALLVLEEYEGAEVSVQIGVPLAALREFDTAETLPDEWSSFVKWAKPVWNLEDAEGAIPVSEESLERLPLAITRAMLKGWRTATVKPPAPLPQPSSDTEP